MRLRAAWRELQRRACKHLAVPLPRMPETNRQHPWGCRVLSPRGRRTERAGTAIYPPLRQRLSGDIPFLSGLRLFGLLGAEPQARDDWGCAGLLCRSSLSTAVASGLYPAPSRLGEISKLTRGPHHVKSPARRGDRAGLSWSGRSRAYPLARAAGRSSRRERYALLDHL